jgi:opacity protein-like surface antigen
MRSMKRIVLFAVLALLAASCAHQKDVGIIRPEINLVQLQAPVDVGYATGPTQIQFEARIANRSAEPITLKRIEIQSVGGGSYVLRKEFFSYNETIAADHYTSVKFWVHGYGFATGRDRQPSSEPVNLRSVVYFDSPVGEFHSIVTRYIQQFPGDRGPR